MRKVYFNAFLFLNVLILLLGIVNLIPQKLIYSNLCESIEWYNSNKDNTYLTPGYSFSKAHFNSDAAELNIMANADSRNPVKSVLLTPLYLSEHGDYLESGYLGITEEKEANADYNRYWHGYQILWRPLLVIFSANTIKIFTCISYIALVGFVFWKCRQNGRTALGVGLCLLNVLYIVPCGFVSLSYVPVFFLMMLGCLFLINGKMNTDFIFIVLGVSTAFFDFLSSETLTLTVPLLCCMYLYKNNMKIVGILKLFAEWALGYFFTFLYKWAVSSVIYQKNYIKIALDELTSHTSFLDGWTSIKYNVNTLMGNRMSFTASFVILIMFVVIFSLMIYLFRRKGSSWKFLLCVLGACCIPYVRYLILSGHSFAHHFYTYRAQLVIIPAVVLALDEAFGKKKVRGAACI